MDLSDITVEVRDKGLNRLGVILPEHLNLKANEIFNGIGTWSLSLGTDHPMATFLRTPGAGIIVTGPSDVLFSGPVMKPEAAYTPDDIQGSVTFDGVTDDIILWDHLSVPQPSNPDLTTQNVAWDTRTGPCESLLHAYVNANIGPSAPVGRKKANLTMGTNLGRGVSVTKKPRFQVLGNLLSDIAVLANLGFRVVQRGSVLVFETYQVVDRTATIRLDIRNGGLSGQRVAVAPPSATRVLVAGQQEGVDRQFVYRDNATSLAAEADWGRRIERFLDQRNTNVVAELQTAADEVLAEEGFTAVSAQVVTADDTTMVFGVDWFLGDKVSVVMENQELAAVVTGMALQANSEGFKSGAVIGDPSKFDPTAAYSQRVSAVEDRVAQVEASVEVGTNMVRYAGDGAINAVAQGGPDEGGELRLAGAGAYNAWQLDNYRGTLRFHSNGTVRAQCDQAGVFAVPGSITTGSVTTNGASLNGSSLYLDGAGRGGSALTLNGSTGGSEGEAIFFADSGSALWEFYKLAGDPHLYFRDLVNGRMILTLTPGAAGGSLVEVADRLVAPLITMGTNIGDRVMLYGAAGAAGSYGFGIESGTLYAKAAGRYRWYSSTNATDSDAGAAMVLSGNDLSAKGTITAGGTMAANTYLKLTQTVRDVWIYQDSSAFYILSGPTGAAWNAFPLTITHADPTRVTVGNLTVGASSTNVINGTLKLTDVYNRTSTSAANMLIATSPIAELYRSTASSRRWKFDIGMLGDDSDLDPRKLYDLPVRQFKFKLDYLSDEDQRYDQNVPGFVAEEVADVYPIAAEVDDDGQIGDWNARMLIPAMLALIQEQNERIAALEAR